MRGTGEGSRPREGVYVLDDAIASIYQSGRLKVPADLQKKVDDWRRRKAEAAAAEKNQPKEIPA